LKSAHVAGKKTRKPRTATTATQKVALIALLFRSILKTKEGFSVLRMLVFLSILSPVLWASDINPWVSLLVVTALGALWPKGPSRKDVGNEDNTAETKEDMGGARA